MKLFFLTTTIILGGLISPVMSQDTSDMAKRLELAKQYSASVPVAQEVEKTIEQLVVQVPIEKRVLLKSTMERNIKVDQLQSVSEMALADVFTVDELEALVAFYSTPQGQAIREKMPVYQSRLEPILGQMIRDAVDAYDRQTK